MAVLPGNAELAKLFNQGLSDQQIANRYGTTRQAVNLRLQNMGLRRTPEMIVKVNDLVPWNVKSVRDEEGPGHHTAYPLETLKLYLRRRLGDPDMSKRQLADARRFLKRLRKHPALILDYDRSRSTGFFWRERTPEDCALILAWPAHVPKDRPHMDLLEPPPEDFDFDDGRD
ncbi:hypothetical protein [Streptomyces sp. URMC 125]|uniref:hypothetical protein n=1 Tax=Streptomyces sp. URMC 125 TaxID=3423419 RepID=UPI003F1C54DB